MFEYDWICRLIDMYDIGKDLSQVIVDIMIEFPISLAEEIPIEHEFIDVDQQFLADTLQQSLQRIFEVVVSAEGFLDDALDELLNSMELGLKVTGVELGVGGGVYLKDEVVGF